MHLQPAYAQDGGGMGSRPMPERLSRKVIALPMHSYLDEIAIVMICETIREASRG